MGWVEGYRFSGDVKGLEGLDQLHPGGESSSRHLHPVTPIQNQINQFIDVKGLERITSCTHRICPQ